MLKTFAAILAVLACMATSARADIDQDCIGSGPDWAKMIRACSTIIKQRPKAAFAYITRCYAYERSNQSERAMPDCNMGVKLAPKNSMAYVNRGAAYIGMKKYDRALGDIRKSLELDPKNATAYVNRAYVYEQTGERDRAVADYRRTLELKPDHAYAKDALKRLDAKP
jgi:tetratricopeptide (TPR) repeat protein